MRGVPRKHAEALPEHASAAFLFSVFRGRGRVVFVIRPRAASGSTHHRWTFLSSEALTTYRPHADHAHSEQPFSCPTSVAKHAPSATRQTRTVLSADALASRVPSGEKRTEDTPFSCPSRDRT